LDRSPNPLSAVVITSEARDLLFAELLRNLHFTAAFSTSHYSLSASPPKQKERTLVRS
jgi:hypothetical protein